MRRAEPDSVADAELVSVRLQLPFDGDLVVEMYGGTVYNVSALPNGIELVVDGHAINDGDPREDMWKDHRKPSVDALRSFVGHALPRERNGAVGTAFVGAQCDSFHVSRPGAAACPRRASAADSR